MQKKVYQIEEDRYHLKEDLTVEESETVQELLDGFYAAGEECRDGVVPRGGIRKFLSLVLECDNKEKEVNEADFGKARESVVLEVIKDFFLRRMRLTAAMTDYLRSLIQEQTLPPEKS
jgi:hypothetical protein